ncbi:hypothetical protein [Flaviaesturariibacter amylovorans]
MTPRKNEQSPAFNYHDFDLVKGLALRFPGTEEGVSHAGTPSVTVRGKLMCRLHDSGAFIPIRLDFALRDDYLERYPDVFHLPEHFRNYPYVCLWVHCRDKALLAEVLEHSWRGLAGRKQLKEFDSARA